MLFHLPNRAYYPQLSAMDETRLLSTIQNVMIYATMELFSFIVLYVVLKRKLHLSALRQLAFVLEKHSAMVQSKLVLWVVFMLQSTLIHYGTSTRSSTRSRRRRPSSRTSHCSLLLHFRSRCVSAFQAQTTLSSSPGSERLRRRDADLVGCRANARIEGRCFDIGSSGAKNRLKAVHPTQAAPFVSVVYYAHGHSTTRS